MSRASPVVLATFLLVGCSFGAGGSPQSARDLAHDYLTALTTGEEDRGWSLILPASRRAYADQGQYMALADAMDWSGFDWSFADGEYCEDGGVYCVVRLHVATGRDGIPAWMLDAPQSDAANEFFTLRLDEDPATPGNAEIVVYFDPGSGDEGVLLGGG